MMFHSAENRGPDGSFQHQQFPYAATGIGGFDPAGGQLGSGSTIKIVRSFAVEVLESTSAALFQQGEYGLLFALPPEFMHLEDIDKFLLDSTEPYCEAAQTFFHYTYFISNGRDMITDLQGIFTDESLILIDPVILRATGLVSNTAELLGAVNPSRKKEIMATSPRAGAGGSSEKIKIAGECKLGGSQMQELFELLYPRTTRTAQIFDPKKEAGQKKQLCGISCGL